MEIDLFTFVAQIVNFAILVALLRRFLYRPVLRAMQERERRIAERLENAGRAEREAGAVREEARRAHEAFEAQREVLLAQAADAADQHRRELFDQAREEAAGLRERWADAIERERAVYLKELRRRAGRRVFAIAERVLRELADADLERQIVERFLERLDGLPLGEAPPLEGAPPLPAVVRSAFELPNDLRGKLRERLAAHPGVAREPRFVVDPDVVLGIELSLAGQRVAWSVRDYLDSLDEVFRARTAAPSEVSGS